ncbi:hypothetical protein L596_002970 [Steinernema carpocapsae]|uniref:RRM domain-containing protein n=1 Tax=Steinernema carpocapsae TaxID=34508 RepID=A0A4V6I7V7_STECR|nr:hypothetical protein L596_002970 [Steinernema carpocapsae]
MKDKEVKASTPCKEEPETQSEVQAPEESTRKDHSNATTDSESEPEYVLVTDGDDGERIELPADPADNTLGFATLSHAFPGAHGLKFRTATGALRALLVDPSCSKFLPPPGGWADKLFYVIYQYSPAGSICSSRSAGKHSVGLRTVGQLIDHEDLRGDQSTKRRKMMEESDSSDTEIGRGSTVAGQNTYKLKRVEVPGTAPGRSEEHRRCTDLIVLGLPYRTTLDQFKDYFEQFGNVVACELKRDDYGNSKGFGFVHMDTYDAQLRVLTKPTHVIDGRKCQVRFPSSKAKDAVNMMNCKLFVGRVSEKATPEDLRNFFSLEAQKIHTDASVVDVFIPKPFRSFAFVTLSHPGVAKELIEIGDFVMDGVSINVLTATPKDPVDTSPVSPRYSSGSESSFRGPKGPSTSKTQYTQEPSEAYYPTPTPGKVGGSVSRNRFSSENRFSPGYMQLTQQRTTVNTTPSVPPSSNRTLPPIPMPSLPLNNSISYGSSQTLASEIDALNLNNPGVVNAAWQAFWSTVRQGKEGPHGKGGQPSS